MNILLGFAIVFGIMAVGLLVARFLAGISAVAHRQRLAEKHTVIAEYEAPTQLSPAELGYIVDASFGSNELLATIAVLYAKGLVELMPTSKDNFQITAVGSKGSADDAESSVLGYLRNLPDATTTWKRFNSVVSDTAGPQADFESSVLQSLVGKGLLVRSALGNALFQGRQSSVVAATILTVTGMISAVIWQHQHVFTNNVAGFVSLDKTVTNMLLLLAFVPLWFVLFSYANLLAFVYDRKDGVPMGATDVLRSSWPDVAGFQLFLRETEYVRLQHDCNPLDPSMAYCLALGLDPGFVRNLQTDRSSR